MTLTKLGGLNIPNPTKLCSKEYEWSEKLTLSLTENVIKQNLFEEDSPEEIKERHDQILKEIKDEKKSIQKEMHDSIFASLDDERKRSLNLASEKGASIWLNTLPIKSMGYALNKQEFLDAIALQYNFSIQGMACHCACGFKNSIDHALICRLGGYTIMRHNEVRNIEADLLKEVCHDVLVEPALIPYQDNNFQPQQITRTWQGLMLVLEGFGLRWRRHFLM